MKKSKTRLKIVLVGFLVFFIPFFLFCYSLEKIYYSTKENFKESLKEKILSKANEIKDNLNPYNYLKNEFSKIHKSLLPDFPEEFTDKTPDEDFVKTLYTEELLNKIISITKDKFSPIIITLGTNNLENVFTYYSEELERQLYNKKDKIDLQNYKFLIDREELVKKYSEHYGKECRISQFNHKVKNAENITYKYLTRFKSYELFPLYGFYTDYYSKQLIYNIGKYSFSPKGIHGYYSLIIPQSQIDPLYILNNILEENKEEIKIELTEKNEKDTLIKENKDSLEYNLKFIPEFTNQIDIYKSIKGIDRTSLLNKQIKLTVNYPLELNNLYFLNFITELLTIFLILIYFFVSIKYLTNQSLLHLSITQKLISVLFIILCLPITGIAFITFISVHNLDNVIDYNVAQNLHNQLEDIYVKNSENNMRRISSIFEIKQKLNKCIIKPNRVIKNRILTNQINKDFLSKKEIYTWFQEWNTDLFTYSGQSLYINPKGETTITTSKSEDLNFLLLKKFYNNLGLEKTNGQKSEFSSTDDLKISLLSQYMSPKTEERTGGQESIPHSDLLKLKDTYTSVFYYAKDKKDKDYLLLTKVFSEYDLPYYYINKLENKNPFIFQPSHVFSEINLGIKLNNYYKIAKEWPKNIKNSVKEKLEHSIISKDNGHEKIKLSNGSIIKEWIFTNYDPFLIAGEAKSHYNYKLYLVTYMIFPSLLSYSTLLLVMLTGLISVFIKKPVEIYKEAIKDLLNNNFGITINSFSKDEFEYITKAFNEMSIAIKQKEQISRYVSSKLIEAVKENDVQEAGNGKQEKVTILSSDIRNFTGISEMYEPSIIVDMLNSYFTKMQQVISANGGIIDKYIGDAIQAVFYDDPEKENQVIRAAKAAITMRRALKEFNKERQENGLFTIENGIGIDTDLAITGTIGTNKGRKDFSVNGDVIDRAAALEAKTKQTESKILISKRSVKKLDCHVANAPRNDGLVYKDFDEESVELIDVRE